MKKKTTALPIMAFPSARNFRNWLSKNHQKSAGIWLQIFKKSSEIKSITYAEALDQALCFGWIDGQKKSHDANSWLQRLTPRTEKSIWSKINTEHAERLIKAKAMTSFGLKKIEDAKADGRWSKAYDSFSKATPPADFMKELRKNKKAHEFFKTLSKTNLFSITYRLQTAKKPETREKRMRDIIKMLARGETFH